MIPDFILGALIMWFIFFLFTIPTIYELFIAEGNTLVVMIVPSAIAWLILVIFYVLIYTMRM